MSSQRFLSRATLKGLPCRHNFLSFPHHWKSIRDFSSSLSVFRIEMSSKASFIASWAGHTHDLSHGEDYVYVSSKFLHANGIPDSTDVIIRESVAPLPYTALTFCCEDNDHWDELSLNTEMVEENMLSQIRVVQSNHIYPLWLEGGAVILLKLIKASPCLPYGCIDLNAVVEFLPPQNSSSKSLVVNSNSENSLTSQSLSGNGSPCNRLSVLFSLFGYEKPFALLSKEEILLGLKFIPYTLHFPFENNFLQDILLLHPSLILISRRLIINTKHEKDSFFVCKVSNMCKYRQQLVTSSQSVPVDGEKLNGIYSTVVVLENSFLFANSEFFNDLKFTLRHKTCIMSAPLQTRLSVNNNNAIILIETSNCVLGAENDPIIDVFTLSKTSDDSDSIEVDIVKEKLQDLVNYFPIVIDDWSTITLHDRICLCKPRAAKTSMINESNVLKLCVNVESKLNLNLADYSLSVEDTKEHLVEEVHIPAINESVFGILLKEVKRDLNLKQTPEVVLPQFILVQGSKGSGKSQVIKKIVKHLCVHPYFVYCKVISMKNLKGKKVDSVAKILKNAIKDCITYQPSLLVIEDLDSLMSTLSVEQEKSNLDEYVKSLSQMVSALLRNLLTNMRESMWRSRSRDFVSVIATCCARNEICSVLSSPLGGNIFPKSVVITPLEKEERLSVFETLLSDFYLRFLKTECRFPIEESNDLFTYGKDTIKGKLEGCVLPDVKILALRVYLEAKNRWKDELFSQSDATSKVKLDFKELDVVSASKEFIPLSSKALNASMKAKRRIKVGGLKEARKALDEMILWPSKYPQIFDRTKLRLRSGLMLYGPPGCGKTLLAQSLQDASHLNFISVKGPEVLSKYIGQSEKSVRDVFERAQNARPCVIFFDEFESIAPRRGHDSTGVTDRVVNQLLTQMDGVEGLAQVYVVAATSRPDLIDPALLRPGRLDKCVYCPLPNTEDRKEILESLCTEISTASEINLFSFASKTEGFSGADLRGLVASAQILAAKESSAQISSELGDGNTGTEFSSSLNDEQGTQSVTPNITHVIVSKAHFLKALQETSPSVGEEERTRHRALHRQFSGGDFIAFEPGKRQTLA